ncbi:TPA: hypothetical protein PC567_000483 [Clostridioides difficile]|nr:hypothetical protein [Clostridioides difficile]
MCKIYLKEKKYNNFRNEKEIKLAFFIGNALKHTFLKLNKKVKISRMVNIENE